MKNIYNPHTLTWCVEMVDKNIQRDIFIRIFMGVLCKGIKKAQGAGILLSQKSARMMST